MNHEISIDEEINQITMERPHLVILGAGASRAIIPSGDKNGKQSPLMEDFVEVVGLKNILARTCLDYKGKNFEEIYNNLIKGNFPKESKKIESQIFNYFDDFELPDYPTIYDHLVLSLREKDLIATFNWDPLLIHAYRRNGKGFRLPKLAFLHGNVRIGFCSKDKISSLRGLRCSRCGEPYTPTPVLYPITEKNYSGNSFIVNEWKMLKWALDNAFMMTIFGYSAPIIDREAIEIMKKAWGNKEQRAIEQIEIIDIKSKDELCKIWEPFIHTHHYTVTKDFYKSWIANHPRRTGEAFVNQYLGAKFISNNPIPKKMKFNNLWRWLETLKKTEEIKKKT